MDTDTETVIEEAETGTIMPDAPSGDTYTIGIDVPDDQAANALAALEALGLQVEVEDETPHGDESFTSVEELVAAERADEAGGEYECPFFPGFFAHVTGSLRVVKEYEVLLREAQRKHNLKDDAPRSVALSIDLDARSMFKGGGVRGWRGLVTEDGTEIPFTEKAFVQMYRSRRVRAWISSLYTKLSGASRQYRVDARAKS